MGLRRQTPFVASLLAVSLLACRKKDEPRKVAPAHKNAASTETLAEAPAAPWFVGRFQGSFPLWELPRAPELLPKKLKGTAAARPVPAEPAELTVTIDREGAAHILLTRPFEQKTSARLTGDEIRARFIPTPEALGSGTVILKRSGDRFEGSLSLLDPSRTRSLAGRIEPSRLHKDE